MRARNLGLFPLGRVFIALDDVMVRRFCYLKTGEVAAI